MDRRGESPAARVAGRIVSERLEGRRLLTGLFGDDSALPIATGDAPVAVIARDFNGDFNLDLATLNRNDATISILLGVGDGTFSARNDIAAVTNPQPEDSPVLLASGDFDGDGIADLAVVIERSFGSFSDGGVVFHHGLGDGTFAPPLAAADGFFGRPKSADVVDLTEFDSFDDLVISTDNLTTDSGSLYLYAGSTSGLGWRSSGSLDARGAGVAAIRSVLRSTRSDVVALRDSDTGADSARVLTSNGFSIGGGQDLSIPGPSSRTPASVAAVPSLGFPDFLDDFALTDAANRTVLAYRNQNIPFTVGFEILNQFTLAQAPGEIAFVQASGNRSVVVTNPEADAVTVIRSIDDSSSPIDTLAVGDQPSDIAVGDFNGDGFADLAVSNLGTDSVTILTGTSDGSFVSSQAGRSFPVGTSPVALASGDVNGDGLEDVVALNESGSNLSILLADPTGGFTAGGELGADADVVSVALAPLTPGGANDLLVLTRSSFVVYPGAGDGTFGSPVTYSAPFGGSSVRDFAVTDFSADGNVDVLISDFARVHFYPGLGDGSFGPVASGAGLTNPASLTYGMFNGDGVLDFAMSEGDTVWFWFGRGVGGGAFPFDLAFAIIVTGFDSVLATADLNGDARDDVIAASPTTGEITLILSNSFGFFGIQTISFGNGASDLAARDFDGDGDVDLAIASDAASGSGVTVIFNDGLQGSDLVFSPEGAYASAPVSALLAGQFASDPAPDLIAANRAADSISVLINQGLTSTAFEVTSAVFDPTGFGIEFIVDFSQPIDPLTFDPFALEILNLDANLIYSVNAASIEPGDQQVRYFLPTSIANGNLRITLPQASVTDLTGVALPADFVLNDSTTFILAGDANRDRVVDVSDLGVLASNWQQAGRVFSEGDFNYDGVVNVADLGILATNWQSALPAAPALTAFAPGKPASPFAKRRLIALLDG